MRQDQDISTPHIAIRLAQGRLVSSGIPQMSVDLVVRDLARLS
jgi:hypothetical protein